MFILLKVCVCVSRQGAVPALKLKQWSGQMTESDCQKVYNFFLSFLANNRHEKSDVEMSTSVNPLALYPGWNATYCCFYFLLLSIQVWIVNNIILVWKILFLLGLPFSLISAVFGSCRCSERCKESIFPIFWKSYFQNWLSFTLKLAFASTLKIGRVVNPHFQHWYFVPKD